jgi:hypothetical protein
MRIEPVLFGLGVGQRLRGLRIMGRGPAPVHMGLQGMPLTHSQTAIVLPKILKLSAVTCLDVGRAANTLEGLRIPPI